MATHRITDNVYSVGVGDPNRRTFDIVMKSPYGTTYNSYLITSGKTVLVDTAPEEFWDDYRYNVGCLCDFSDIDYIVINHTEPDHSGCIKKILDYAPDAVIVCTAIGKKFLRQQINRDFKCITVKDGDTLDIGRDTLHFVVTPMLHWPDSMMVRLEKEGVLCSCDMFGAHYCEMTMFDEHIPEKMKEKYRTQTVRYYEDIFSPFSFFVRQALDKIKPFAGKLQAICPSHGPVIVEGVKEIIKDYKKLSAQPKQSDNTEIAVVYASAHGCTERMAKAAAEEVEKLGAVATLYDLSDTEQEQNCAAGIGRADGLLFGTTTINCNAPAPVWRVISQIDVYSISAKPAGVFGSYGWSGEGVSALSDVLGSMRFKLVRKEPVKSVFEADKETLSAVCELAKEVFEIAKETEHI